MKNDFPKSEQTIKPPKLIKRKLVEGIPGGCVLDREQYRSLFLSGVNLSNQVAAHVSFEEVLFSQVNMANTRLEEVRLEDARPSPCDRTTAKCSCRAPCTTY